jgi:hypothetical protein
MLECREREVVEIVNAHRYGIFGEKSFFHHTHTKRK